MASTVSPTLRIFDGCLTRLLHDISRDVDQPFDARLELDERAVVGQADHLAAHARADRVALHHVRPRIGDELLVAERDALGRRVVLEHDHVDLVVDLEELGRMADAAPRHVGDVQQAVDAAEVDERAVVGDVLDDAACSTLPSARMSSVCFFFSAFSSSRSALRDSTMLPRFLLTLMTRIRSSWPRSASRLRTGTHVDLRAGQERADADVDREPALDPLDDAADDDLALGVGLLDLVPDLHLLGFFAREDDVAFAVFGALEQDVDDVAGLHRDLAVLVEEFV